MAIEWEQAMAKFGPLVFSHYFRGLRDEQRAFDATQSTLRRLGSLRFSSDLEVVRWVRALSPSSVPLALVADRGGLGRQYREP
jgi:hypothetical protein